MARDSIVPLLLRVLEPHLERLHAAWLAAGGREPTLPMTGDKVNVRRLVQDLMALDARVIASHEQHFFRKAELQIAVNRIAEEQGLAPIGSRAPDEADEAARSRIGRLSGETSDLRRALAEREATIESLRRENTVLREQIRLLEETGMCLRTGSVG